MQNDKGESTAEVKFLISSKIFNLKRSVLYQYRQLEMKWDPGSISSEIKVLKRLRY